ncbi:MAG TPA: TIGR03435 family protein [Bryobacteraceae bacterium]|jgi:uncharacterized protein (TIGR03435 family)|nr:TIGR03435 family protein [Bryobacteraceae bacterium]
MRLAIIVSLVALPASPGCCQSTPEPPRFEIADVRPSAVAMNPFTLVSGGVLRGDRYDLRKASMLDLIRIAYAVPPETVVGGPNWLEFDRFDIAAKAPAQSSPETVRRMLQSLLVERFHLAVHNDMRPMPAWVLSMGKTKPKLAESSGAGDSDCQWVQQPAGSVVNAYSCRNLSMAVFAARLQGMGWEYLKEPVVDATGLEGAWDFDLRWNRRSLPLPGGAERITLFDAVSRQLGLNLTLRQAPAPVLVIDRVEKPTPNAPDIEQKLPPRQLEFEVADVKLNKSGQRDGPLQPTRGGGLEARAVSLKTLLGFAWDMDWDHTDDRFIGLPKGIGSVYVDINARTTKHTNGPALENSGYVDDDVRAMTRALLTQRFQITWHYEDRLMEGYSLVSARPKLKKADPANRASCHEARTIASDPRDSNPLLSQLISCRNATIAQLAVRFQQIDSYQFAYPVEDATGIKGTWDFDLGFTPRGLVEQSSGQNSGKSVGEAVEPSGAVTLAEAVSKQLGLRLEKRKRLLPAIVIDHMELTPIEN